MRRTWIAGALCALSITAVLPAQGGQESSEHIRREIDERQQAMREGRVVRSNVRITLRLRNGSRLKGVVKDGRFVERPQGLEFLPTEMTEDDAGIRLWYYNDTNSFIFLPYTTIAYHKIGDRLTDDEVRRIAAELDKKAEERSRLKVDPDQTGEATGDGTNGEAQSDLPVLADEQKALLAEFPPEQGWGYDRMRELEARKIRIGVYPNEKEQKFLDSFEAWNQAFQLWQQIEELKRNAAPSGEVAPTGEAGTEGAGTPPPIGALPGTPGGLPTAQKGATKTGAKDGKKTGTQKSTTPAKSGSSSPAGSPQKGTSTARTGSSGTGTSQR
ncbi:MAG: hypothetical protein HZB39_13885 [Planctomycetes bacterium]|nr:hypothetical protein [Planctomycetota bacterium]